MKPFFSYNIALLVFVSFMFLSCSSDDEEVNEVSDQDVEIILKSAIVEEGGFISDIKLTSSVLANSSQRMAPTTNKSDFNLSAVNCNQTVSNSYQNTNTVGLRSWDIQTNWSWTLNCDQSSQSANFDLVGNGTVDFDGPNVSKDITKTHLINIAGLGPTPDFWIYNTNHNRTGFVQINTGNQNSYTTNLDFGSTDIYVSKTTQEIVSGNFQINLTITLSNGNVINRGASVIFNGNQTATVTLNNGVVFNISW